MKQKRSLAFMLAFLLVLVTVLPAFGGMEKGSTGDKTAPLEEMPFVPGVFDIDFTPETSERAEEELLGADPLPAYYNSVDLGLVPEVRDQGVNGTCWAFSTLDTSWISMKTAYGSDPEDLYSPFALAYFFFHTPLDPLRNTGWDSNVYTGTEERGYLDAGGNVYLASMLLAGRVGATNETDAPYEKATPNEAPDPKVAFKDAAVLENAYYYESDATNQIKRSIMEHGAVSVCFCATYVQGTQKGRIYKYVDPVYGNTVYQPEAVAGRKNSSNHAVVIVGWNDNVPASAFGSSEEDQPNAGGAWLVRNSWGTGETKQTAKLPAGEGQEEAAYNGYFWLSYADSSIGGIAALECVPGDTYDRCYEYDLSAGIGDLTLESGESCGNIWQAEEEESIVAVMNVFDSADVDYSVQIYTSDTEMKDPTDGTPVFEEPVRGETFATGIYTLHLPEAVYLKKGTWFSVVYTNEGGTDKLLLVEKTITYDDRTFTNDAKAGVSYLHSQEGWEDAAPASITFRIKALTVDPVSAEELILPEDQTFNKGWTWIFGVSAEPEEAVLQLDVSSSDEAVATACIDGEGCVEVKMKSAGIADITVTDTFSKASGTVRVTVTDYYESLSFEKNELSIKVGESAQNKLAADPETAEGDELKAAVLDPFVASAEYKDGAVTVTGKNAGTTRIYLISQKTEKSACFTLTVNYAGGGGTGGGSTGGSSSGSAGSSSGLTFSSNFKQVGNDWYFFRKNSTEPLKEAWLCDDAVAANGKNVWYLFGTDGKMVASPFVRDAGGNYYSLETAHNGYYGSIRYKNGTYDGIYMEFSQKHDGTFGAITNQAAVDALKAKYKLYAFGKGNESSVYSANEQ